MEMKIEANSVNEYFDSIPEERKAVMNKLRSIVLENIPDGFEETLIYKMPGYVVPHSIYPSGYHCNTELPLPFINIASQKNFIGFYHMGIYSDPELLAWFKTEYAKHCKFKLDMGKSCIRLKKMDDIPFDLFAELCRKITVKDWINTYEKAIKK